jgi:hypothetical protein
LIKLQYHLSYNFLRALLSVSYFSLFCAAHEFAREISFLPPLRGCSSSDWGQQSESLADAPEILLRANIKGQQKKLHYFDLFGRWTSDRGRFFPYVEERAQ